MTALAANDATMTPKETLRWTVCALAVLLAHVLAALTLIQRDDVSDIDAGSPVALIELARPVTPSSTETDLPAGPMAPDAEQRDRIEASEQKQR